MRNWVLYLGVLGAGAIGCAAGVALRTPDVYVGRWLCYLLGGAFMTLGVGGLAFGHPAAFTPFPEGDGPRARWVAGWFFILFGGIGAIDVAVWYPFDTSPLRPGERSFPTSTRGQGRHRGSAGSSSPLACGRCSPGSSLRSWCGRPKRTTRTPTIHGAPAVDLSERPRHAVPIVVSLRLQGSGCCIRRAVRVTCRSKAAMGGVWPPA